jgi:hypothetical protein
MKGASEEELIAKIRACKAANKTPKVVCSGSKEQASEFLIDHAFSMLKNVHKINPNHKVFKLKIVKRIEEHQQGTTNSIPEDDIHKLEQKLLAIINNQTGTVAKVPKAPKVPKQKKESLKSIKQKAKSLGIKGFSKRKRDDLLKIIAEHTV